MTASVGGAVAAGPLVCGKLMQDPSPRIIKVKRTRSSTGTWDAD